MKTYAYVRVSTDRQEHISQIQKIKNMYTIDKWYEDKGTGRITQKRLWKLLKDCKKNDRVIVYGFDRLGRNVQQVLMIADQFKLKQVSLISIRENIDLNSPAGNFVFQMLCSVSEFEVSLISERVKAGLEAAQKKGIKLGRPKNENKPNYDLAVKLAVQLRKKGLPYREIQKEVKSQINVKLSLGDLSNKLSAK